MSLPNCRDVARTASGEGFEGLEVRRRWMMRLHLAMCSTCRRYVRQIDRIRDLGRLSYRDGVPTVEELNRLESEILAQLRERPPDQTSDS